jgi:PAS domain S-box-containing protein
VFQKSLRLRLIMAFAVMVSLILGVGVVSYAVQADVRDKVSQLRSGNALDLTRVDLAEIGLEFHGYWNPNGQFVADDIEVIPPRRPRLRGEIQELDRNARTVTMYGTPIAIVETTDDVDDPGKPVPFDSLRVGQRIEMTCEVAAGTWRASSVRTRAVKSSDKIKGQVRAVPGRGDKHAHLEMHGIEIVIEPKAGNSALGALAHIEQATQMIRALQGIQDHAHRLVRAAASALRSPSRAPSPAISRDALTRSSIRFAQILDRAYGQGEHGASIPTEAFRRYLDTLRTRQLAFSRHVRELTRLVLKDPEHSRNFLESTFDPFVADELIPGVHAYLSIGEEELGDGLRELVDRTETTTKVALGAAVLAVGVAILLGLLVWRSIQRPLQNLHDAAVMLGRGHLDTRVVINSRDELGVLAEAFNAMAVDLAATTVSMTSLENVFDSMAAALIIFDADGRILNVNRATSAMLDYERDELIGKTFDAICRCEADESVSLPLGEELGGRIASVERVFAHKDGSVFPVSLSGAELRDAAGTPLGHVCVAQDLTNQKHVEATIRQSLAEKELLLHEVHHRVKNNMQVISSLLAMQTDDGNAEVTRRLEDSQNRIRTIALIHELLYHSPELAQIDIRSYLEVLADHLLQSYGAADSIGLDIAIDDVELNLDESLAIGLIVNELTTNSLKHAFVTGERGRIRISLTSDTDGTHTLQVSDDGCGTDREPANSTRTLGTSLVATLAKQLHGTVEVHGGRGTTTRVVFVRIQPAEAIAS